MVFIRIYSNFNPQQIIAQHVVANLKMTKRLLKTSKYLAISILVAIFLFFGLVLFPLSKIEFPDKNYAHLLIKNINIVDVKNNRILENQFVLISGNKITQIADKSIPTIDEETRTIDGNKQFLIPALWDMHIHLNKQYPYSACAEFVINGVMHVRDMRGAYDSGDPFASTPERIENWNEEVAELDLLGPKIHNITSLAVEGPHPMFDNSPDFFNCSNEREAKLLVDYFKNQGVDLIKTYNNIPRKAFFTLLKEAQLAGIDVAGHKPVRVSTIEASKAGMKSLEHARFLIWDSYGGSEELRNDQNPKLRDNTDLRERMLIEHDTLRLNENLVALKSNGTWYCPTHLTRKADAYADDSIFRARYDKINPILRFLSFEDLDGTIQEDTTLRGRKVYKDFYLRGLEITKKANEKGVGILAGSDVPELPGTSLIDELEELSRAGLSNFDVLKAATLYPTQYYDKENQYGTIEVGKTADMIILSQNPIADISAVRNINSLIYNGVYLDEINIKRIKETIHSRNRGLVMSAKLIWDMIIYSTL